MTTLAKLDKTDYYRAILSRDKRYDGLFYFAVKTTGIYCRPSCPAPRPLARNIEYYITAEEARRHNYRPCKRCHPDSLIDNKHFTALETIHTQASSQSVSELAHKLHTSERQLRRIVQQHTGATPSQLWQTQRLHTAKMLLTSTNLSITDVAFSADFPSLRQFNHVFKQAFSLTPREFRRQKTAATLDETIRLNLRLRYKQPFACQPLVNSLKAHAIPGLEAIDQKTNTLTRLLRVNEHFAKVIIDLTDYQDHVKVSVETKDASVVDRLVGRLRRLLDLDHNPAIANATLLNDPLLAAMVTARPGLRIAGSFSPFELMVFTIIGQQISVAAARTLTERLVKTYGQPYGDLFLFPQAVTLSNVDPLELYTHTKLNHKKIATLQTFAQLIASGLDLEDTAHRHSTMSKLLAIKGIGPWSIEYVALRGLGDPNAFPADDLLIKRRLGAKNSKEALLTAQKWQPFRGYAAMHIWTEGAYL